MSHNTILAMARTLAVLLAGVALGGNAAVAQKVTVCHIPPGNPAAAHKISIDPDALAAHLAHGDLLPGSTFTFNSGAATAGTGPGGAGPITSGTGNVGDNDPITTQDRNAPPPAVIRDKVGAWGLIPGSAWISFDSGSSPPNGITVHFSVVFTIPDLPGCAISPSITVRAMGDDNVNVSLNGSQVGPSPFAGFTTPGSALVTTGILPGANTITFSASQTGGDGFGVDFQVMVVLD